MDLDFQPENLPPKPDKAPPPTEPPAPASAQPISMVNPQPKAPEPPAPELPHPAMAAVHPKKSFLPVIIILAVVLAIIIAALILIIRSRRSGINETASNVPATSVPAFDNQSNLGNPDTTSTGGSAALPSSSTTAGRDATRKEDVRQISTLLAAYYADNQSYPVSGDLDKLNSSTGVVGRALVPKYASKLPVDPLDPDYFYAYISKDGKSYELSARLESTTDSEATLVGSKYLFIIKK